MIKRAIAAVLGALMLIGLTACGASAGDYMAEAQKVGEWSCYETRLTLEASAAAEKSAEARFEKFSGTVNLNMLFDLQNLRGRLSGGFEGDVGGLDLYGARADMHAVYDEQTVYLQDGIVYLPVKLVRDAARLDGSYYDLDGFEDGAYIALDLEWSAENRAAFGQLQSPLCTAGQYRALGSLLGQYTTDLRFQKSGCTYTLSGKVEQLPAEMLRFYVFCLSNIVELNDLLNLGLDDDTMASLLQTARQLQDGGDTLAEIEKTFGDAGVSGDFTAQITFEDQRVTQQCDLSVRAAGDELSLRVKAVSTRRSAVTLSLPEASGPMTAQEFTNLLYGWSEENTPAAASVELETGYMETSYWDGQPAHVYDECPVRVRDGQYLFGFRALMEGMGFGADYDAVTDSIYFVDKAGERTRVDLYEENGRSFITAEQLSQLGFSCMLDDERLWVEYAPGADGAPGDGLWQLWQ